MSKNTLILVGGGGHCRSCIEVVHSVNQYTIIGIIDKDESSTPILGIPIIGNDYKIPKLIEENNENFMITLGQIKSSAGRRRLVNFIHENKGKTPVIIASSGFISRSAEIGNGTTIMHNAFINANSVVGNACIINTGALIEHDVKIGDFCHISTKSVVNGGVTIGSDCFIGSGAIISQGVSICDRCVIGAGSVIIRSIEVAGVYAGNPVRRIDTHG